MAINQQELFSKLDLLIAMVGGMDRRLATVETEVAGLKTEVSGLKTEVAAQGARLTLVEKQLAELTERSNHWMETVNGSIIELRAQQSIMVPWMQGIDQRFTALMAPYAQPAKATAGR